MPGNICAVTPVHFKLQNFQSRQSLSDKAPGFSWLCSSPLPFPFALPFFPPPFELPQMMSAMPCSGPLWPTPWLKNIETATWHELEDPWFNLGRRSNSFNEKKYDKMSRIYGDPSHTSHRSHAENHANARWTTCYQQKGSPLTQWLLMATASALGLFFAEFLAQWMGTEMGI